MTLTAEPPPAESELVVVGAGILGLATARELLRRRPGASLAVLEAEQEIAAHQTGHTSGVIHAGIYYEPGSLKARLCVEGARALYGYCEEREIPVNRNGKLIVATEEAELQRLDELERRGHENDVPGLRRVAPDEIAEIEPHVKGIAALHSAATGVVDFAEVARGLGADVGGGGGSIHCGCAVQSVAVEAGALLIGHRHGHTRTRAAVFCAGLWSDRLAVAAGAPQDPRIVPIRGGYLRLKPARRELVCASVYPVPDPELPFLGPHLTRGIDSEVLIGPTALIAPARDAYRLRRMRPRDIGAALAWPGTWRLAARHWRTGLAEIRRAASQRSFVAEAARYVPELEAADVDRGPAGVRAQALSRDGRLVDDFVIHRTERAVHVRNAPSPAATSSLALARLIADQLGDLG
ncbi:MAG: L-2-hydroxyglutarate oxidase [Actinomycetota bacterium]